MSEESPSTISDEVIDEIFAEPSSPEETGEGEPSSQSDGLEQHLQTVGLSNEEIQELTGIEDPEARATAIVEAATKKADARIRGMQSGFSQLSNETKEKASQLDQLRTLPGFREFLTGATSGEATSEELDLSKVDLTQLPEDGLARYQALTEMVAKDVVGKESTATRSELTEVKNLLGNLIWSQFTDKHPDAAQGQDMISHLVGSGLSLDQAYMGWVGMNTDPTAIEERTLERVKARFAEKKKASTVPAAVHEGGELPATDEQKHVDELVKEKGLRGGFMAVLAERAGNIDL